MPRFGAPPRSDPYRRSRDRSDDFYGPLDMLDDLGNGFIGGLLDLSRYAAESTIDHSLYYAGQQARRLGRKLTRRFGER